MSLEMQGSGRECWENSPHMDLCDPYSRERLAQSMSTRSFPPSLYLILRPPLGSVERETERPDRRTFPESLPEVPSLNDSEFGRVDPTGWYPHYKDCVQHFVERSQHAPTVQSVAAFINIRLPAQCPQTGNSTQPAYVSLRPYVRRLIVTAQDSPTIMRAFFGDNWEAGVGCIYKQERINYLFTAKSSGWADTKTAYDMLPDEQTPFLRPIRDPSEEEIRAAEARWSEWLAMEDWMVGTRSPW